MFIGKKVKQYLIDHGISQAFLSSKSGMSRSKLNLTLNGKRPLSAEEFVLICKVLEQPPDRFISTGQADRN